MHSSKRRLAALGSVLIALGGVSQADAATRSAGPLTYVTADGTMSPYTGITNSVVCPGGSASVGAAGNIGGKDSFRHLSALSLLDGGDLGFDPDDGSAGLYSNETSGSPGYETTAICLRRGEQALDYVTATDTFPAAQSASDPEQPSTCPAAQVVLGGGGGVSGDPDQTALRDSFPSTKNEWDGAFAKSVTPEDRTYGTQAACLPSDERRTKLRSEDVSVGPSKVKTASVACPKGYRASGGGSDGGNLFEYFESTPYDSGDADKAPDDGWRVRVRNLVPNPSDLSARVLCLGPRKN